MSSLGKSDLPSVSHAAVRSAVSFELLLWDAFPVLGEGAAVGGGAALQPERDAAQHTRYRPEDRKVLSQQRTTGRSYTRLDGVSTPVPELSPGGSRLGWRPSHSEQRDGCLTGQTQQGFLPQRARDSNVFNREPPGHPGRRKRLSF